MHNNGPAATALGRPTWLAALLSLAIVTAYFSFILLVALAKPLLGTMLAPGVSLGLVLAAGILILCILTSFVYVVVENRKVD